jgi:hypothetical protein
MLTMYSCIAETTMTVLGKEVADPHLQLLGFIMIVPLILGMLALVLTQRMIDEERVRAEPSIAKLFGGLPPRRVLSDRGKKVQTAGFISVGIGGALLLYLIIVTR